MVALAWILIDVTPPPYPLPPLYESDGTISEDLLSSHPNSGNADLKNYFRRTTPGSQRQVFHNRPLCSVLRVSRVLLLAESAVLQGFSVVATSRFYSISTLCALSYVRG